MPFAGPGRVGHADAAGVRAERVVITLAPRRFGFEVREPGYSVLVELSNEVGNADGGRLHAGFGHAAEAVRQLRGEAGARQVAGAEVAALGNVGGFEAGAALLTRW